MSGPERLPTLSRGDNFVERTDMRGAAENSTHYFGVSGLIGLEILAVHWVEHSHPAHVHDFYSISLNCQGRGSFYCRQDLRHAVPGTCSLIAPGELHTGNTTSRQAWIFRCLHIEVPLMNRLLQSLDWNGRLDVGFKFPLVSDFVLARQLDRVFASSMSANSLLQNESLLLSAIARLVAEQLVPRHSLPHVGREPMAVQRVKDWLHAHPEQNVSVHSLADVAGLSPYYLVRAFHKHVGIPPHKYQTALRLKKARTLLKSGVPISDVACRTGFYDQSHLTRYFKATFGVTPGAYTAHCESI